MAVTTKNTGAYWVIPTGNETTDTAAFQAAKDSLQPIRIANNGTTLRIGTQTLFMDRDVDIDGNGVRIEQVANVIPIFVSKSTATSYAVSALADVQHDLDGASSNTTLVTRLTLTTTNDVNNIVVGDFYKVTSEDKAPGGAVSQNPRMGEIQRVVAVDAVNGYVYMQSQLYQRALYVTDVKITRFAGQDYNTRIRNLRFRATDDGIAGNWTSPPMWLEHNHLMHVENVVIERAFSTGALFLNNYGSNVSMNIREIHYDLGLGQLGYGVLVSADNHSDYAIRGRNCRHVITDGWTSGASGSVYRHGPVLYSRFTGHADGCWGAGFDFHDSAARCTIHDVISSNNIDGPQGLGAGIQVRGFQNTVFNCSTIGNEWGIQAFANNADGSDDLAIVNHISDDKQGSLVFVGHGSSVAGRMKVRVKSGVMRWAAGGVGVIATLADLSFQDTMFAPRYASGGSIFSLTGNTDVRGTIVYDGTDAGGTWTLAATSGSNNNIRLATRSDDSAALPANNDHVVTDTTPDIVTYATALTAERTVTFSCQGRRRVLIKRTAGGAFNVAITLSGTSTTLTAANQFALVEVDGAHSMLIATGAL